MQLTKDRRQRAKIDAVRFKPLIASPAVGPFIMPGSATLFALSIAGCAAGTTAATYTSSSGAKAVKTPLLVAGGSRLSVSLKKASLSLLQQALKSTWIQALVAG